MNIKIAVQVFLLQQIVSSFCFTITQSEPFFQKLTLPLTTNQPPLPLTRSEENVPASTPLPVDKTLTSPYTDRGELFSGTTQIRNAVSTSKPGSLNPEFLSETRYLENEETSTNTKILNFDSEDAVSTEETVTPSNSRRSRNDLYFCCAKDNPQPLTLRPERERNTKAPTFKKKKKSFLPPGPHSERRPALLVRFFPDGTAVLISKFQVYLHVKPKQISFEGEEPATAPEQAKSFEVTYKHLESLPLSSKPEDTDYHEGPQTDDAYEDHEEDDEEEGHKDHVFISTTSPTTDSRTKQNNLRLSKTLLQPLVSTSPTVTSAIITNAVTSSEVTSTEFREDVLNITVPTTITAITQDSSSLQEPSELLSTSLDTTSTKSPTGISEDATTTEVPVSVSLNTTEYIPLSSTNPNTSPNPKCLNSKNQLSVPLSTEDNISDTLLKKHLLPIRDCSVEIDESEPDSPDVKLGKLVAETTEMITGSSLEFSTAATTEQSVITTHSPAKPESHPVAYQLRVPNPPPTNRDFLVNDAVVVTSVPMMIQLNPRGHHSVTSHPAWREVTVGVVRNQQGQPLKPPKSSYNNWDSHLRGLKKRTQSNELWKEATTPSIISAARPTNQRLPLYLQPQRLHQNVHPSPSRGRQTYWDHQLRNGGADKVRNEKNPFHRGRDVITQTSNKQLYYEKPSNFPSIWHGDNSYRGSRDQVFLGQHMTESQRQHFSNPERNRNRPVSPAGSRNNQEVQESRQRNWGFNNRFHGNHRW